MKKLSFKIFSAIIVCTLLLSQGCKHQNSLTTEEQIRYLYNNNQQLFNNTIEIFMEDAFYNEMKKNNCTLFLYKNSDIVECNKKIDEPVSYNISDEAYLNLLKCFQLMESIIDKSYKQKEYTILAVYDDDYNGFNFYFNDETTNYAYILTFTSMPNIFIKQYSNRATAINENWFYWGFGGV